MDRAGLVGDDGPTHHGAFDISYLRACRNIVLMAPRDEAMLVHMLRTAIAHDDGPIALRYPRGAGDRRADAATDRSRSRSARARRCAQGERVALLGYGYGVQVALERRRAAARARASTPTVADARFAKPLDAELLEPPRRRPRAARDGRGERPRRAASARRCSSTSRTPSRAPAERARVLRVGLPDRYVTHGKPALLHEEVGLTGEAVAERVLAALARQGADHRLSVS